MSAGGFGAKLWNGIASAMPFLAPRLPARVEIDFDDDSGTLIVSVVDGEGRLVDPGLAIGAAPGVFMHHGRAVRLPAGVVEALSFVAEFGGLAREGMGFVIAERDAADAISHLRGLRDRAEVLEMPRAERVRVESVPLEPRDHAEMTDHGEVVRQRSFVPPGGAARISASDLGQQARDRTWIRSGSTFFKRPMLSQQEVEQCVADGGEVRLRGDAALEFVAREKDPRTRSPGTVLGPRAARATIATGEWLPKVSVDLTEGELQLDVTFDAGGQQVAFDPELAGDRRRFLPTGPDTWIRNDQNTQEILRRTLTQIPSLEPSGRSGHFVAPAQSLPVVQEILASVGTLQLTPSAEELQRRLLDFEAIEEVPLPAGLRVQLRPYQRRGYDWLCFLRRFGLAGVLADDMGLGKTIQTLAALLATLESGDAGPSLVVCPASVTSAWEKEVADRCSGLRAIVMRGSARASFLRRPSTRTLAITTYNSLVRTTDAFQQHVWSYVILDEAHRIKNASTATARACRSLRARHKVALTGTPVQNRLAELWSIFEFLRPGYLGTLHGFERDFANPIERERDPVARKSLQKRIDPFKLRRIKEQVAKDLPELERIDLPVDLQDEQRAMYDAFLAGESEGMKRRLQDRGDRGATTHVLQRLMKLRRICAHPRLEDPSVPLYGTSGKFDELRELLDEALESEHRVLVFSQWTGMCNLIAEHLQANGIRYDMLHGQVPTARRGEIIHRFQDAEGPSVLVLSLLAGGEGITLTRADTVFIYDRWWNPAVEDQAVARAHRIGQMKPVTAYFMEAADTVESRVVELLHSKRELAGVVEVDDIGKHITREMLLEILEPGSLRQAGDRE